MAAFGKGVGAETENGTQEDELAVVVEPKVLPESEYKQARFKRRIRSILGIIVLFFVEFGLANSLLYQILQNDLATRVTRETENRKTGTVQLTQGTYEGNTDFGYFIGKGTFSFTTGSLYNGDWENNQMKGVGTLKNPSEGEYSGSFLNSQKNGFGTYIWSDQTVYRGEWKNDQMWGQGEYQTSDGVRYSGTFMENAFANGVCVFSNTTGSYQLTYKNGSIDVAQIEYVDGTSYNGDCDRDGLCGNGTMVFNNGDQYQGDYNANRRSGFGVYQWSNGDQYDGEWSADQMTGTGTYTFANGSYVSGTFDNNQFIDGKYYIQNDFGVYTFTVANGEPNAVEMELKDGTTYRGSVANGELTGQAQIQYSNGDKYSGSVQNGVRAGQGTYAWASGASYEGAWSGDKMSGTGTYYYPKNEDGYKLVGTFENGKPHGECQYYENTTTHYKTDWVNGKCKKVYE
ncbi:MORN repeat-containing protein [Eubacteriales bacterium SGI.150]